MRRFHCTEFFTPTAIVGETVRQIRSRGDAYTIWAAQCVSSREQGPWCEHGILLPPPPVGATTTITDIGPRTVRIAAGRIALGPPSWRATPCYRKRRSPPVYTAVAPRRRAARSERCFARGIGFEWIEFAVGKGLGIGTAT